MSHLRRNSKSRFDQVQFAGICSKGHERETKEKERPLLLMSRILENYEGERGQDRDDGEGEQSINLYFGVHERERDPFGLTLGGS